MARPEKKTPEQWYQEILSAAQSLFITKGYEETSVNDIMDCVGGAKGMFYHSFQSKDELLNVLVDKWAEQYVKEVSFALYDSKSTFVEKFIRIMDNVKQMSEKTEGLEAFFTKSNQMVLRKLTEEMTAKLIPPLSSALRSGIAEGVLSIDNTDFYANYIIHGTLGALNFGDGTPKEKISKNLHYLPKIIADTLKIDITDLIIYQKPDGDIKNVNSYNKIERKREKSSREGMFMLNENCPCKKKKCERHGKCDECRKHHADSKRQRPVACERTAKKHSFNRIG